MVAQMRGAQFVTTPKGWRKPATEDHMKLANRAMDDVAYAMGFGGPGGSYEYLDEMKRRGKRILGRLKE